MPPSQSGLAGPARFWQARPIRKWNVYIVLPIRQISPEIFEPLVLQPHSNRAAAVLPGYQSGRDRFPSNVADSQLTGLYTSLVATVTAVAVIKTVQAQSRLTQISLAPVINGSRWRKIACRNGGFTLLS